MLNDQELNQIRAEAEKYSSSLQVMGDRSTYAYKAYIAAATLYQERINGLLEALELIKYGYPTNQSVMIADKSLTNYNESLKG